MVSEQAISTGDRAAPASWVYAASGSHSDDHHDLVGSRAVRKRNGHCVKVVEGPGLILVSERHIDGSARRGDLHVGRDDCLMEIVSLS